jgi:parallel beta-helix repeat protein
LVAFSLRVQPAKAWTDGTVYIRQDGSVDPADAPILRNGDVYTLTSNINITTKDSPGRGSSGIVVQRDNTILDGAYYTISNTYSRAELVAGVSMSANNVTVRNFHICNFWIGIRGSGSSENTINENNIDGSTFFGIRLESNFSVVSGNQITNCQNGVGLFYCSFNCIVSNDIVEKIDEKGIELDYSNCNNIIGNNITRIDINSGVNNSIYHNHILSANCRYSKQIWDDGYPSGGNYWSDYYGIDFYCGPYQNETGSDGIGDTAYIVSNNNTDHYPWMMMRTSTPLLPKASWGSSPYLPRSGDSIVFNASRSISGWNGTDVMPIKEYEWDFGDGNITSATQPIILHAYFQGGVFNVTLTITDSQGLNSSRSGYIWVLMPTSLSVTTNSASTVMGYIVSVYGNLSDAHGIGLANELVMLYYTFPGSSSWYPISSGSTDSDGKYYVQWMPQATGYFTIKAEWGGNATHIASNSTVNLSVLPYQSTYAFSVESNSTVTGLTFDTTSQKLSFSVSGPSGTTGYAKVTIAKALVLNITMLQVSLDDVEYSYSAVSLDDSWLLTFTYNHSIHQVNVYLDKSIIPEFPTFPVVLLFMATVLLLTCALTRRRPLREALCTTKAQQITHDLDSFRKKTNLRVLN